MRLSWLSRPLILLGIPIALSFAAWAAPGESLLLRGFAIRAEAPPLGWVYLIGWYSSCAIVIWLGFHIGRFIRPHDQILAVERTDSFGRRLVLILTVVGALGVGVSYSKISGSVSVTNALMNASGNDLSTALGTHAGLTTLRYMTIAAMALCLVRLLAGRREPLVIGVNTVMLLLSALITSRMSLVMCALAALVMIGRLNPTGRLRVRTVIALAVLGFSVLTALNAVRNANFYEAQGVTNPVKMNVYQIGAYLGTPMQASVGVANSLAHGTVAPPSDLTSALDVLTPTFLQEEKGDKGLATYGARYGDVSFAPQFNSNSAFADIFTEAGWFGLLFALVGYLLVGLAVGHFSHYRGFMVLGLGVSIYPIAEIWRLYLPNQGIYLFLLAGVLVCGWLAAVWERSTVRPRLLSAAGGSTAAGATRVGGGRGLPASVDHALLRGTRSAARSGAESGL